MNSNLAADTAQGHRGPHLKIEIIQSRATHLKVRHHTWQMLILAT